MLVELVAQDSGESRVAHRIVLPVYMTEIASYGQGEFVGQCRGIHGRELLSEAGTMTGMAAKLREYRCSQIDVKSFVQVPRVPSSEVSAIKPRRHDMPPLGKRGQMQ